MTVNGRPLKAARYKARNRATETSVLSYGETRGLLSLGVIVFVLLMAAFFLRLFFSGKPQNEQ